MTNAVTVKKPNTVSLSLQVIRLNGETKPNNSCTGCTETNLDSQIVTIALPVHLAVAHTEKILLPQLLSARNGHKTHLEHWTHVSSSVQYLKLQHRPYKHLKQIT